MELYVKMAFIPIFSFFLGFKRDFIRCIDFTSKPAIGASNAASDNITN